MNLSATKKVLISSLARTSQLRNKCTNNIDSYHHTIGSVMPPVSSEPGAVTLLNMRFCPYAQRTVLCLNTKNIDYEVINCQLMTKPSWLLELNPLGKVPVLLHNEQTIYESLVTCEYIEEVFPGRSLHRGSASERARDRMLVELFNSVIMPQMRIWFGVKKGFTAEDRAKQWATSMKSLAMFETELSNRAPDGYFSGADSPGWLDYMIWPWMERIEVYFAIYQEAGIKFPKEKFPVLSGWIERMLTDPAVSDYFLDVDTHVKFMSSIATGSPNYNLLSETN